MSSISEARAWVSIDPYGAERGDARLWCLHVNREGAEIGHLDVVTESAGWSALAEVDSLLALERFVRGGAWQLGSGRGYVAWVEEMAL